MTNKLDEVFNNKKAGLLNVYCSAGYPHLNSTTEVILSLQEAGADMIEVGIPYSDPIADGPVIQRSNNIALGNGMSIPMLFSQLESITSELTVPLILMGYFNPILQYGVEDFCKKAAEVGVTALIIPDLPIEEYQKRYKKIFSENNLHNIFLITPQTPASRIKTYSRVGGGFIYAVSSPGITGGTHNIASQTTYFEFLKNLKLKLPFLVGFGIKSAEDMEAVGKYAAGGIVGSAYIEAIKDGNDISVKTKQFVQMLRSRS